MLNRDYPLDEIVQKFFEAQGTNLPPGNLDVSTHSYIEVIRGIVSYFKQNQSDNGRIIDPYVHQEKQYSTPAYAASAACLVNHTQDFDLLSSAIKALDACLEDMVHGRAADGHSNFYTTMLVCAFEQLQNHVSQDQIDTWKQAFDQVDWKNVYRTSMNNWGIVQLAGEWMRNRAGLGSPVDKIEFDDALFWHTKLITEYGMYVDPNGPMAYDMFSRNYFLLMLLNGYDGSLQRDLMECLRRGTLTSLFLQSPTGEMPTGGRSAQHQWNEAQQAFQFEQAARYYAKHGGLKIAGAFKRAAHLSLVSISRWVRPTGELQVVKNYASPMIRTGFEAYSFHSQYNLLAAYFLSLAFMSADDSVQALPCPAETGGFSVWIEPFFHKLFVNVSGNYVEIQTRGEPNYNPTGVLRLQKSHIYPLLGPSDAAPSKSGKAIAYALAWANKSGITRLAELERSTDVDIQVHVSECSATRAIVNLEYRGSLHGASYILRKFTVTPEIVIVCDEVVGDVDYLIEEIPVLLSDGRDDTLVTVNSHRVDVCMERDRLTVLCLDSEASPFSAGESAPCRNGALAMASYRTTSKSTTYLVKLGSGDSFDSDDTLLALYQKSK